VSSGIELAKVSINKKKRCHQKYSFLSQKMNKFHNFHILTENKQKNISINSKKSHAANQARELSQLVGKSENKKKKRCHQKYSFFYMLNDNWDK
jgi:hypothetical protein